MIEHKAKILDQFKCQNSGNCCKRPGYVYVTPEESQKMATILGTSQTEFEHHYTTRENGWRIIASPDYRPNCFLDDCNKCQVYNARPKACRSYPDWPEIWESDMALKRETRSCPALKKAVDSIE